MTPSAPESAPARAVGHELTGTARMWAFAVSGFFTLFLSIPAVQLTGPEHSAALNLVTAALLAAYGLGYLSFPYRFWHAPLHTRLLIVAGMTAAVTALLALHGAKVAESYLFVISAAAIVLPLWWGAAVNLVIVSGLVALFLTDTTGTFGSAELGLIISVAACSTVIGHLIRTLEELRRARAELARLAVVDERERMARELHDILGHTLTAITVKVRLAQRLLDAETADPAEVRTQLVDSEHLARQSMGQLREVVSDYRTRLPAELAGARIALRALEIELELEGTPETVHERYTEPFAYIVREGVTNIIRHSGATRCRIRLGPDWMEITDDGPHLAVGPHGNGLTGLTERMAAVGGGLSFKATSEGGHLLRAESEGRP